MDTNPRQALAMPCPQAEWVPRLGLGWVALLRDTVPGGGPGFWWHKQHPQPALGLLWAMLWVPLPGGSPQPQAGSVLAAESCCASVCQPGGTGNRPLCLTALTLSPAFFPGPMEMPARDATLLDICFRVRCYIFIFKCILEFVILFYTYVSYIVA